MKRTVPRLITSAVGILLILTTFVARPESAAAPWPVRAFDYVDRNFSVWFNLLAVFAFIVGGANLLKSHGSKILRRRTDWGYSVVTLVSFVVVLVIGLFKLGGPPGLQGEVTDPGLVVQRRVLRGVRPRGWRPSPPCWPSSWPRRRTGRSACARRKPPCC